MYFGTAEQNAQYQSVRSIWSIVLFKLAISLLIFCLNFLTVIENKILKSTLVVLLSFFSFRSFNDCFIYLDALVLEYI